MPESIQTSKGFLNVSVTQDSTAPLVHYDMAMLMGFILPFAMINLSIFKSFSSLFSLVASDY